jgi:hypothetical protein
MILELQNAILEKIATGEPLAATISDFCLKVEAVVPGVAISVRPSTEGACTRSRLPLFRLNIPRRSTT